MADTHAVNAAVCTTGLQRLEPLGGAHPFAKDRANWFVNNYAPVFCFGQTKGGMPKHPLYLRKDTPLIELDAHALRRGSFAERAAFEKHQSELRKNLEKHHNW
jgi:hypothetical protein